LTTGGISGSTGNLYVNSGASLVAANITQNTLNIASGSTVSIADSTLPGDGTAVNAATSVLTDLNNSGTLDLKNNDLIIADPTQFSNVQAALASSYDAAKVGGGHWDQPGITSSSAAIHSAYGLAEAQIGSTGGGSLNISTFDGQSVSAGETVVKYTLLGDTTLKGNVSLQDYVTVVNNFGLSGKTWTTGDFFYNGTVSLADYVAVVNNFGLTSGQASPNLASPNLASPNLASPRSVSPSLKLISVAASPSLAASPDAESAGDVELIVNVATGDVELKDTTANNSAVINDYEITSLSGSLVPFKVGGAPHHYVEGQSLVSNEVDWATVKNLSTNISEGQDTSGTQDTNPLAPGDPSGYQVATGTYDLGDIFKGVGAAQDLTFGWADSGGADVFPQSTAYIDYVGGSPTPEPGTLGVLGLGGVMMMRRRRRTATGATTA
jgi:hypothetical protein